MIYPPARVGTHIDLPRPGPRGVGPDHFPGKSERAKGLAAGICCVADDIDEHGARGIHLATFEAPLMTAIGLLAAGNPGHAHAVSREEIFVALAGTARVEMDGETRDFRAGDALVIPAHTVFKLSVPGDEPFEAVAILPVGAYAQAPGGDRVSPPWAQ